MNKNIAKEFSTEAQESDELKVITVEPVQAALKQGYGVTKITPKVN